MIERDTFNIAHCYPFYVTNGLPSNVAIGTSFKSGDTVGVGIQNNQLFFSWEMDGAVHRQYVASIH